MKPGGEQAVVPAEEEPGRRVRPAFQWPRILEQAAGRRTDVERRLRHDAFRRIVQEGHDRTEDAIGGAAVT